MAKDRLRRVVFAALLILGVISKLYALRECHCTNGCDVNFRCNSGGRCQIGWTGPTCQKKNIALGKNTKQSSTANDCQWATDQNKRDHCGDKNSSLAVDGSASSEYWSGTCTHTVPGISTAWWSVELGKRHLVSSIRIYFSDPKRMKDLQIKVDNSHCYQRMTTSPLTSPLSITCNPPVNGRRVNIQLPARNNKEIILNLCEVEIYECGDGWFGDQCFESCNCRDVNEICDKITGNCNSGCAKGYTGVGCSTECDDGWFGHWCRQPCNCKNVTEICEKNSGHCISGCAEGYTGEVCSIENIAFEKTTYQSSTENDCKWATDDYKRARCGNKSSSLAVNGQRSSDYWSGTCTHTKVGDRVVWWTVDLGAIYRVYTMKIYFSNALRMMSFRVLVDGSECYVREGSGHPSSPINITCGRPVFGQNVTIELKKNEYEQRILNLCEVEIYGNCRNGSFGQDCEQSCNCGNESEICNKTTGQCNSGCAAGYNGVGCQNAHVTDCKDGWFGPDCRQECKCKDIHEVCNKTTGQCVYSGCEDGWTGLDCYTECKNGTYGFNCSHLCGRCFGGVTCGKIEGECAPGCEKGFTEPLCQKCADGYYGQNCSQTCGRCRNGTKCKKANGECKNGCEDGFSPPLCQECQDCYYSQNCSLICGGCLHGGVCGKVYGECIGGCEKEFSPPLSQCLQTQTFYECSDGFYGLNCSNTCGQCLEGTFCDKDDGECPTGCRPGWKGQTCSQKCSDGFYGLNCSNTCGQCLEGTFCDKDDGECPTGCRPGWKGQTCSQKCKNGTYGSNCSHPCGQCFGGEACGRIKGECAHGCEKGFTEPLCQSCSDFYHGQDCKRCGQCRGNKTCDRDTGQCPNGCLAGWKGKTCQKCADGYYGQNCSQTCGRCRNGTKCKKANGKCKNGCEDGFSPPLCQECQDCYYSQNCSLICGGCLHGGVCGKVYGECIGGCEKEFSPPLSQCLQTQTFYECSDGFYGLNCSNTCGNCSEGTFCDKDDGECPTGCRPGWKGQTCSQKCSDGFYGLNCSNTCGQCSEGTFCDKDDGECPTGCRPGWKGQTCSQKCSDGFYGLNCSNTCGQCLEGTFCDKDDGECPTGCRPGWKGQTCSQKCGDGFYGLNCSNTCGQCSEGTFCDKDDGECPTGCRPGWKGQTCSQKCSDGFYGLNCSNTCGQCLEGTFCDKDDGECPTGCRPGRKGQTCSQSCNGTGKYGYNCNETCGWCVEEEECEAETGHCPRGCAPMYEGVTCQMKKSSTSDTMTARMGVLYSFICILAVGLLVAVYVLKRRQKKTTNEEAVAMTSSPDSSHSNNQEAGPSSSISASAEHAMQNDENEYMNVEQTKVKVSELRQYIARRTDKFEFEYTRQPKGLQYPHSVAANQANKGKNRFKAIYPYDHSRVVLQQTPGIKQSDYINASYIDTYKEKKVYIATQGPNPLTVGDFWRMVWQEKAPIIVMLTRLAEGIKVKCEQYWPDEGKPMTHGDLQITTEAFVQKADYVIRELTVHNTKLNQKHPVTQLHYVTWPDHDVPSAPALVRFWKVFRSMAALNKKPFIVHCSAGVGRTGTFIGLDVLVQRARDVGMVDVYDYVKMMREDRVSMVQTKEQYLFLHQVILEALYSDRTSMTPTTFETLFPTDALGSASEQSALQEQWKNLQELNRVLHDKDVTASLLPENIRKTRVKDILPADKHRPILALPVPETNDYINAVFVPSDSSEKGLVATQLPLPWTVVDFWRLVIDHNIRTVVTLDPNISGRTANDEGPFWPQSSAEMNCDPFVVSKIETKNKQTTSVSLQVWLKESAESTKHEVQLVYMSEWPRSQDTPTRTSDFLHLLNEVNILENSGPVAVMCRDGATRCGLFCAAFNIIQRLKADNDIDIYLIIRQLQTIRPSFVPSYGQFQFCYQMVKEFQKTVNSVYENFQPSCQ